MSHFNGVDCRLAEIHCVRTFPSALLQFRHNAPRITPVTWSWSTTISLLGYSANHCPQIAQRPPCFSISSSLILSRSLRFTFCIVNKFIIKSYFISTDWTAVVITSYSILSSIPTEYDLGRIIVS